MHRRVESLWRYLWQTQRNEVTKIWLKDGTFRLFYRDKVVLGAGGRGTTVRPPTTKNTFKKLQRRKAMLEYLDGIPLPIEVQRHMALMEKESNS